jgi:lauroyl/myristoyl acyltransferase
MRLAWWAIVTLVLGPVFLVLVFVAFVLALLPINQTKLCRKNLRERYGSAAIRTFVLTCGVYLNYAVYFFEAFVYWRLGAVLVLNKKEYFSFLNAAVSAFELDKSKKGFLFLGAHYCVIEQIGDMMNQFLRGHHTGQVNVLFKPSRLKILSWFLATYRRSRKFKAIETGNKEKVRAAIAECFENGDSLALVVDQKPKKGGIFVEFFGEFASFPSHGIEQALSYPAVCVANTARRVLPGIFRLEYALMPNKHMNVVNKESLALCEPSPFYVPAEVWKSMPSHSKSALEGSHESEVERTLAHYTGWLEEVIRLSPTQWCWDYRKWSRRPAP